MGAIGALNGVVDGVDVNVGGPGGGLLATDDTVEVGGRLTVGGVILLSDFFRFRPLTSSSNGKGCDDSCMTWPSMTCVKHS